METVKGYAGHEKDTFNQVTQARANMANATTVQEVAEADTMLTSAAQYPDLPEPGLEGGDQNG